MEARILLWVAATATLLAGCVATTGTRGRSSARGAPAGPIRTASTSSTTIPAGTTLAIRVNETISAERADPGRSYSAQVAEDVVNERKQVLVPRGAEARLLVLDASTGGAVGSSGLELALSAITSAGRTYTVDTNVVGREGEESIGANERTARNVGGGALLGAVIGAMAGGGSGAAAGAAIGAAAGGTAQVLTRGGRVDIPAESILTFRLENPIQLR